MSYYEVMRKLFPNALTLIVAAICLSFAAGMGSNAWAADVSASHKAKAKTEVEKFRIEAAQALAEAQKAMIKADEMMRIAQQQKEESRAKEKDAFQKMLAAGYYPSEITLTTPTGKVRAVFSHKKHLLREQLKCTECHPKVFSMSKKDGKRGFTMKSMKTGHYCGNCHDGKKAFSVEALDKCKRCHVKQL